VRRPKIQERLFWVLLSWLGVCVLILVIDLVVIWLNHRLR
jgi:hypothetical protein